MINIKDDRVRFRFENYSYSDGATLFEGDRFMLEKVIINTNQLTYDFQEYVKKVTDNNNW